MAKYRFWLKCALTVIGAFSIVPDGRSQPPASPAPPPRAYDKGIVNQDTGLLRVKVYSLADLGNDPNLCKWIAETIPQMIEPGSWGAGKAKLSYYAPSKVMAVHHTGDVHAQVDAFLQSLKKSLPAKHDPHVVPAQFAVPEAARPLSASQAYPVPATPTAPKHLFHFIIRYEGEGVIDSNVVKFTKALSGEKPASNDGPPPPPPPCPPAVGPVQPTSSYSPGVTLAAPVYLKHPPRYFPTTGPSPPPSMPPADAPENTPPAAVPSPPPPPPPPTVSPAPPRAAPTPLFPS